jgi:hydroxyacylglutathione hydrolase
LQIFGSDSSIPSLTHPINHQTPFIFESLKITPLKTPCHTKDSVCYFVQPQEEASDQSKVVFTGDTLFIGGCGRFFEGHGQDMYQALAKTLGSLPDDTLVFCGHEYTVANLEFALTVDPSNSRLQEKWKWAKSMERTIPSTIGDEKATNPFMRVELLGQGAESPVECMTRLRSLKDHF